MKTKRKVQKKKCRCDEFGGKNSKMGENDHFFKCPLFMSEQQNKEECVPIDICYTSIPPQTKCKNCGRFWFPSEEKTPICSAQTSPLTMEDWEKELREVWKKYIKYAKSKGILLNNKE